MEQTESATISLPSFEEIFNKHQWEEIPNCPGRYVLEKSAKRKLGIVTPVDFLEQKLSFQVFQSQVCRDTVHVTEFPSGGGIISYQRSNGTFLHTLNNSSGSFLILETNSKV